MKIIQGMENYKFWCNFKYFKLLKKIQGMETKIIFKKIKKIPTPCTDNEE